MTAWRCFMQSLGDQGGGPLHLEQIDCGEVAKTHDVAYVLRDRGLIRQVEKTMWEFTYEGWEFRAGRMALVNGQRKAGAGSGRRKLVLVRVIGQTVPDETIERLLIESGYQPNSRMTPEVIRAFANYLVDEARGRAV